MATVSIYSTGSCPFCQHAKALLHSKGITPQELDIGQDRKLFQEMLARSGCRSVPQIFIGDRHVGGFDDLVALDKQGKLAVLLRD